MNALHPLSDLNLKSRTGDILAQVPLKFEDSTEGTLVIEVDVGIVEAFLSGVSRNERDEVSCWDELCLERRYDMPIADAGIDKPDQVKWQGNVHYLRQLRRHEFGLTTVAFIVTQAGLDVLEGRWPFEYIGFYR